MKVSQYICDFDEKAKKHDAQIQLIINGESATTKKEFDACANHTLKMITSEFLNDPHAKVLSVIKINGAASTKIETKSEVGRTYEKKPCPAGCGRDFAPQGLRAHLEKFHPDYEPPAEES